MKKKIFSTIMALAVMLSLFGGVLPAQQALAQETIYVDASNTTGVEDGTAAHPYNTIQEGITAATVGDTIIVSDSTYNENVNVTKSLTIQSVNGAETTIVQAASAADHVFEVTADYVTISGFTVTGASADYKSGIYLGNGVEHCTISNNTASSNVYGIDLYSSSNNTISGNTCSSNSDMGIVLLYGSSTNTISGNITSGNGVGIYLEFSSNNNTISGNTSSGNNVGIYVLNSSNNTISGNTTSDNSIGITLYVSSNSNTFYLNSFSNTINVGSTESTNIWHSPEELGYTYQGNTYTGYLGNYYSNYTGADDGSNSRTAGDGISDTPLPYTTDGDGDNYPLMATSDNYTQVSTCTLTITVNPSGSGTTDPPEGSHVYAEGTEVEITATAAEGYSFVNWSGDITDASATTSVTMDADKNVTANFEQVPATPVHNLTTGGNFETIQMAIDDASTLDGHTIQVDPGTYTENVNVNKQLTIESTSGDPLDTTVVAADPNDHVFEVTASYVNISGFTVKGASVFPMAGIYLKNSSNSTLTGNIVSNNPRGIWLDSSHTNVLTSNSVSGNNYGIFLENSYNNTLTDNTVSNAYVGIDLVFSSDNTLTSNTVSNHQTVGIRLTGSANNTLSNNIMLNNLRNFSVSGILSSSYNQNIDTSNTVNGKPIQYLMGQDGLVIDSSWEVGYLGIVNSTNITVKDLTLIDNEQGLLLANSSNSRVENVNVSNNRVGIAVVDNSSNNTVTANTVSSNHTGIYLAYNSSNNTMTSNTVSSNETGISFYQSSTNTSYLNNLNNTNNVYSYSSTNTWNSPDLIAYAYNSDSYTNYLGNYWSNYSGFDDGTNSRTAGDGVGDTNIPYPADGAGDSYPLMATSDNYVEAHATLGSISGHVYESDGETAIAGATVTAFQNRFNECGSAVTDQYGYYQITGLASGEYGLQANATDHASQWYENSLAANGAKPVSVAGDANTPDIDFTLGPGAVISGHVYQAGTTTGIENTIIIITVPGAQGGLGMTLSGQDGSYTTFGLPEGNYGVWALANGHASKWYNDASNPANATPLHVPVPGGKQNIDFSLESGVPVSGHVYQSDGHTAIEGAQIAVFGGDGPPYALGWTIADGSYTTTGLLAGNYFVTASANGYIQEYYEGVYNSSEATIVPVTIPGGPLGIDFTLDQGGTISGYVRQPDGQTAIAGATINVFDYNSLSSSWIGYTSAITDSEGHYMTSALPAWQYGVRAQASGYADEWYDNTYIKDQATPVTVSISGDRSDTNFTLEPACSISGTVLDKDTGNPVDDSSARSKDLTAGWHKFVYRSEELWGTSISRAAFKAPGDADWRWFSTSELNIRTAPEGGGQSGITLTTKKNNWTSHPTNTTQMAQCVEQDSTEEAGWYGQSVVTIVNQDENIHGNDDNFTSYYEAYFYVDNPGTWRFSTDSDDASDILIDDAVTARWYDGHGAMNRWEHKSKVTLWEYDSGTWINEYNTNADGSYTISGLPSGSYRLMAKAQGYINEYFQEKYYQNEATAVILGTGQSETDINFTLERSGNIMGSVKNAGGTATLANLSVECRRTIDDSKSWHTATTDSNGNFTIGGLPYGDYMVRSPGGGRWGANDDDYIMEYYNEKTGEGSATLVTVAGPPFPTGIILTLETGNYISGNVIADGGGNIANLHVYAEDYNTGEWKSGTNTDTDGNYTLHGLPAGTYRVRAVPSNNGLPYADEWYDNTYDRQSASAVEVLTSQTGINFSLAAGGSISGKVTAQVGGANLANVSVECRHTSDGANAWWWGVSTDSAGNYVIKGLPLGDYVVRAPTGGMWASGDDSYMIEYFADKASEAEANAVTVISGVNSDCVNFTLTEGGTISGRVTAEVGGQGIDNLHVYAEDYSTGAWKAGAFTNPEGYYTLYALPTGTYRVKATPSNTGLPYAGKYFNNTYDYNAATAVPVIAGENKPGIDFSLPTGGTISGTVRNADGSQTLAGMHVHADLADYSAGWGTCTGSDGTYTIGDLPYGQYRVYADSLSKCGGPMNYLREYWQEQASSTQAALLTVDASTSPTEINFTLAEGGTISGTVKNATSTQTLANISVECRRPIDSSKEWRNTTTDSLGNYTLTGLPYGDYIVRAPAGTKWGSGDDNYVTEYFDQETSEGTANAVTVSESFNPENVDFTIGTGGSISGSVKKSDTTTAIANLHLYAVDSTTRVWTSGADTDASGNYTIHGLPTGSYLVRACASCSSQYYVDEYYDNSATQSGATAIPVTEGLDTGGKNFILDDGGSISGYVKRSSDNSAVSGASVYAFTWDSLAQSSQWFYRNWTTTDGQGFYRIYGLPAGNYGVRASASTYATKWYDNKYFPTQVGPFAYNADPVTVTASEDKPEINFNLESGGSISGYVKTGGAGIGGATVRIYNYNDNGSYGGVTTSGNGYYQFSGLASGQYTVRAIATGYATEWYSSTSGVVYTKELATAVEVAAPADTPNVNFDLVQGGTISGRVTATASGNGIGNISVMVLNDQGYVVGSCSTNTNGDYTTLGILPGDYTVKVQATGYITEWFNNAYSEADADLVTVSEGANTPDTNFSLETAVSITGVSVQPQTREVSPGDTFTVEIRVDPKVAIAGVQFDLTFDPNLVTVNVNGVAEGDLLSQGGTIGTSFLKGTTNNTTGKITGVAGVISTEGGGTVSAPGTFAIITMTAMAVADTGTSQLQLSNVKVGDENANPVPAAVSDGSVTVVPYDDWDVNCDGDVNVFDMILIGQNWGKTGTPHWIRADVKRDGIIDVFDMILIGQHWTG